MNERAVAIVEVCSVILVAIIILWLFEACQYLGEQTIWLGKGSLLLLALLAIALPGRSLRAYGLLPLNPGFTIKWSVAVLTAFVAPAVVAIGISAVLGVADFSKLSIRALLLSIVWYMVFTGFVEEALFRGYVQTRLEAVFGKKWRRLFFKSWRVSYGYGLLIASVIFGVVHIVEYWNPLIQRFTLSPFTPVHIFMAFALGIILGALREASGDVYVSVFLHGGLNTATYLLLACTNLLFLNAAMFTGFFMFFYMLDKYFHEAELTRRRRGARY